MWERGAESAVFQRARMWNPFQDTDHELGGFKNDKGCHYKELYGIRQVFSIRRTRRSSIESQRIVTKVFFDFE